MAQQTTLTPYGVSGQPYGSFAGKEEAAAFFDLTATVYGHVTAATVDGFFASLLIALATEADEAIATEANEIIYDEGSTAHSGDTVTAHKATSTVTIDRSG